MFTGIIRHLGVVRSVQPVAGGARLMLEAPQPAAEVGDGDSVCVHGVCLTVTSVNGAMIGFDVITETLRRSTLGALRAGERVHLEPSLRLGGTLDGHFVQGHVDGTAEVVRREASGDEWLLWCRPQPQLRDCIIPKGSIALDGVSLTIASLVDGDFSVALIPTTLELTTLGGRRAGDRVNVESDIIARTVVHHLKSMPHAGGLSMDTLKAHGFA